MNGWLMDEIESLRATIKRWEARRDKVGRGDEGRVLSILITQAELVLGRMLMLGSDG